MEFSEHVARQKQFSERTFGPGHRTEGILRHIEKEMQEIREAPQDIKEWIDIIILGMDGAWRAGFDPQAVAKALEEKQRVNRERTWPDWRKFTKDQPIEHIRGK